MPDRVSADKARRLLLSKEFSGERGKETTSPIRPMGGVRREHSVVSVRRFGSEYNRILKRVEEERRPTIVSFGSGFAAIVRPLGEESAVGRNVVSSREFRSEYNRILKRVEEERRPTIVSFGSDFAAIVQPLSKESARMLAKESARELIAARSKSEQELASGDTRLASELAAELGIDVSDG
jgi:hypothetical protein